MTITINGTSGISGVDGSAATPALQGTDTNTGISFPAADTVAVNTGGSERVRCDSSGRVGIGTNAPSAPITLQADSSGWAAKIFGRSTANYGEIGYYQNNGTTFRAGIYSDDSNGLRFRVTDQIVFACGSSGSQDTERMRIGSNGQTTIQGNGASPLLADRLVDDGVVIAIKQDGTTEGSISVSGTTVTYGGGHLARWSQLPNSEDPSDILKGTVMSNLDEMCEWGEEDNEQLNKTKVSDVEGDKNVAGVFVSTSFSDDGPLDFFVGMTGDMVIRIAEGVTVERGDLLMSAGDGTAKPQDDDIIRSKTIAKVTSTNVSCTYDDGSYCVPCVLMAC